MKRTLTLLLVVVTSTVMAAEGPSVPSAADREASRLEVELVRYKDTSPEAADILAQLVDLYYENGRVFGLIRTSQRFIVAQTADRRHKSIMLKRIDALEALSRNEDLVAACRQFLERYPDQKESAEVEIRLARTLERMADRSGAAKAWQAVWYRQPKTPAGRQAGARAIRIAELIRTTEATELAAVTAEDMVRRLPAGPLVGEVGNRGFRLLSQLASERARANALGKAILDKNGIVDKKTLHALHSQMAANYQQLQQYANAVDSLRKALAIKETPDLESLLITLLSQARAEPAEIEATVAQFLTKYPDHPAGPDRQALVARAYETAGDKETACLKFKEVLLKDPAAQDAARRIVYLSDSEPATLTEIERLLLESIKARPDRADYVTYILATDVYDRRMKDRERARTTIRKHVLQAKSADRYAASAAQWLLQTAPDEAEFRADVDRIVAMLRESPETAGQTDYLSGTLERLRREPKNKPHISYLQSAIKSLNSDPLLGTWFTRPSRTARANERTQWRRMVDPAVFEKLSQPMQIAVVSRLAEYQRYQGRGRGGRLSAYARWFALAPEDYRAVSGLLVAATDENRPEHAKRALDAILQLEPPQNVSDDLCARMMGIAQRAEDAPLGQKVFAWVKKAESVAQRPIVDYRIGDALAALGMEKEAMDYWIAAMVHNQDHRYSYLCAARVRERVTDAERAAMDVQLAQQTGIYQSQYRSWVADDLLAADDLARFEETLRNLLQSEQQRAARKPNVDATVVYGWLDRCRDEQGFSQEQQQRILGLIRDLECGTPSAIAHVTLLNRGEATGMAPIQRLLSFQAASRMIGTERLDWNRLLPFARSLMEEKQYGSAAALLTGLLANVSNMDESRRDAARALTAQCYARIGAVGMTIDEESPLAPLLRAALYLRLGDERLAFEALTAHRALFAAHRQDLPGDLLVFACERLIAAGGEENLTDVEMWLREWIIRNNDSTQFDDSLKAQVQLLLAQGYFKAQRYDVARAEFTTLVNRFPDTSLALEAQFGIGETYVAQKVYDQAMSIFDRLAQSPDSDVVVRAEFLRGVVAFQRDDVDEARDIFRAVLDRVPNIALADQALYRLSEIYGLEQRYLEQLTLLRTVGRLGRTSKRTHVPGQPLSVVVYDSDLGISRGHNRIPVVVTTVPGGDQEQIFLTGAGAGKGLFRADLDTHLGKAVVNNRILELTGRDTIRCDYPEEFRGQFRTVPLSDVNIQIAAEAAILVASTKEFEEEKVTFSEQLQKEAEQPDVPIDPRLSQTRPLDQIKPGNPIYVRVTDEDRDMTDELDEIIVKVSGDSGDQVQVAVKETGSHSGVFEGMVNTGELPAGATASDSAIGQQPILAIDQDPTTYWQSEPDGRTPKSLTVDMKDLRRVTEATFSVPDVANRAPVRAELQASYDGAFWFRLGGDPPLDEVQNVTDSFGRMRRRVFPGNFTKLRSWQQVIELVNSDDASGETEVDELVWSRSRTAEDARDPAAVVCYGKLVQPRSGAVRIQVAGANTALVIDSRAVLPVGDGTRSVDVWLSAGSHELTVFAATTMAQQPIGATWARANLSSADVRLLPFLATDFDLSAPEAQTAGPPAQEAQIQRTENHWQFQFEPVDVRYLRLVVHEYIGDAVAVSHVEVRGEKPEETFIPPAVDVVSLANNQTLEIAGGETITATYVDEAVPGDSGHARVIDATLTATYFDGDVSPIVYRFEEASRGGVNAAPRRVLRIEPGERFIVQVRDYDEDRSNDPDTVPIEVIVNDGEPITSIATETEPNSGVFTKEIDTAAESGNEVIEVKPGDRIFCRYPDKQNTFPGHSVFRETIVLVNEPTDARVQILDTIVETRQSRDRLIWSRTTYRRPPEGRDLGQVTLGSPMTVEVIDPDSAKDAESSVTVALTSGEGVTLDIQCILPQNQNRQGLGNDHALLEGRFVGQVFLQLGGKETPDIVPLMAGMQRLIGGPVIEEEEDPSDPNRRRTQPTITRALNVRGTDPIAATFQDQRRADGKPAGLQAKARLIETGQLECTDQNYLEPVEKLYLGERLYVRLIDPDRDTTDARDTVSIEISSSSGEREDVQIEETLPHSGVFTGSFLMTVAQQPTAGNYDQELRSVEAFFGDTVSVKNLDTAALTDTGAMELLCSVPVVIGTDGAVAAFTKVFADEDLAVETQFTVAESHFELFKSHRELGRQEEAKADLEAGRAVLRELMDDRLDARYAPRVAYLLGQFAQELEQWNEAISAYQTILRQFGEHSLAPDAQYKLAQCYEKMGDFDLALEAYVTLAATYPKSPLVADVMIRIADHFFQKDDFEVAAQVGKRFVEKFEGHQHASRMAFRIGQCRYKAGEFSEAGESFDEFARFFADDQLAAEALFWAGESYRMARDDRTAYQRYNRCRWDFPSSEAAKYARGRLALPEMLRQFEADSRSVLEPDQ